MGFICDIHAQFAFYEEVEEEISKQIGAGSNYV